jgi:DNA-binding CsgD family transcriptional regulator
MPRRRDPRLSVRQWECLALAADHRSAKEIARTLGIAPSTVNDHLEEAIAKLGAGDRRDAARMFVTGLAGQPPDGIGGDSFRVAGSNSVSAELLAEVEGGPATSRVSFHFLRGERQNNELDRGQRLLWIVAVSVAAAILFSTAVIIVDRLKSLLAS